MSARHWYEVRAWLQRATAERLPLIWTGHGASFAIAEAFAASLRTGGANAFTLTPGEVERQRPAQVCVVSRSGSSPDTAVDLLIGEQPPPIGRCRSFLEVRGAGESRRAWFPAGFVKVCVEALAFVAEIRLGLHQPLPRLALERARRHVIVLGTGATAAGRLLRSAEHKLGDLGLIVLDLDEVGHGFHSRLHAAPSSFVVHVMADESEADRAHQLVSWCGTAGVVARSAPVMAHDRRATPLAALLTVLGAIESRCADLDIETRENPLPESLDRLRHPLAVEGGAPCR